MKKNKFENILSVKTAEELGVILTLFAIIFFWFTYLALEMFGSGRIATILEVALVTYIFTLLMVAGLTISKLKKKLKKAKEE